MELEQRADGLKGGTGFGGFLKGAFYTSRNKDALSEMKEDLARAVELFKVCKKTASSFII